MIKSQCRNDILAKIARASNTTIEYKGTIAYDFTIDLLDSFSYHRLNTHEEMISSSFPLETDIDRFRIAYLRSEILSKYDDHPLGINTESVAWGKFHAAEAECGLTNRRLFSRELVRDSISRTGEQCIHTARQKILGLLGDKFSYDSMLRHCRFSGGASTTNGRSLGHPSFKFILPQECTPRAKRYVDAFNACTGRSFQVGNISPFNKATTVPKNSKTDRCIAIEPGWNMFFQLGVGGMIREKLRFWGIDLNNQSINQKLAQQGSIDGTLATIDLSAASDTIAFSLVELLLPPEWFKVLSDLRSPMGQLPNGDVIHYEKFSSMGNGFTFELESLIFAALARSVCEMLNFDPSTISVYGDDIIAPTEVVDTLKDVFSYCGFTLNTKKTFSDGDFRESCGKHYKNGVDVSPFFIRRRIVTPSDLILVLNQFYRWATIDGVWDPRAWPVYVKYRNLLPVILRKNYIPDGYGDGALVGSFARNPYCKNKGWIKKYPVIVANQREVSRNEAGSLLLSIFRFTDSSDIPLRALERTPLEPVFDTRTRIMRDTGKYKAQWLVCSSPVLAPFGVF